MTVSFRYYGQSPGENSTYCIIVKQVGLTVGDLMVAQIVGTDSQAGGNLGAFTAPENWASIRQDTYLYGGNTPILASALFWKIADAADVAATNFTFTATNATSNRGTITAIYGHDPTTPINEIGRAHV